ncbi:MAG: hypothetical protein JNN07_18500 [Verrucomicrobiales bacterium]|nr:hypothetical protein [Verrucomicrobiales bacterium]
MSEQTFPSFLVEMVQNAPKAGSGVHSWLFSAARHLHHHFPDKEDMREFIASCVERCGRLVPTSEIDDAIRNSAPVAWRPTGSSGQKNYQPERRWPNVDPKGLETVLKQGGGLDRLHELSAATSALIKARADELIGWLFPGNPLLCCSWRTRCFDTLEREEWGERLANMQFIVPNPMAAKSGLTKDGRTSKHTLNNTGPRRFLVVEFDQGSLDSHATILTHLATFAPLICVVFSGSKSLHGWFLVENQAEALVLRFFRYAVSLGADSATWSPCQFVRMPNGLRENGKLQEVHFLNLAPLKEVA